MAKTKAKSGSKTRPRAKAAPAGTTAVMATRATKVAAKPLAPAPGAATPGNKEIYGQFCEEILNNGRFERAAEFLDPVVVTHNPLPGQEPGAAGFVAALTSMREAFPDLHVAATHVIAEGEHVAARFQVSGTHHGDFIGIRATGRTLQYEEFVVVRFAGGRIVEHWGVADGLAIMQQLGGESAH